MDSCADAGLDYMAMLKGGTAYKDGLPYFAAETSWGLGSGTGELVIVLEYLAVIQSFGAAAMAAAKSSAVVVIEVAVLMIQVEGGAVIVTWNVVYAIVTVVVNVVGSVAAFAAAVAVDDFLLL